MGKAAATERKRSSIWVFPFFFFLRKKNLKVAALVKGNYSSVPAEIQLRQLSTSPRDIVVY